MTNQFDGKETDKRMLLQSQMVYFIESVLIDAERQGKLDHINIEVCNHQGNLQMDYTLRNRKKAY